MLILCELALWAGFGSCQNELNSVPGCNRWPKRIYIIVQTSQTRRYPIVRWAIPGYMILACTFITYGLMNLINIRYASILTSISHCAYVVDCLMVESIETSAGKVTKSIASHAPGLENSMLVLHTVYQHITTLKSW